MKSGSPNKPDAANPAIAPWFQVGRHGRGVGDPGRSAARHVMPFINPMWDNEAERIGKQRCTPLGYALHTISDLLGFVALLLLFGSAAYLGYRGIVGSFRASLLWLFTIPFALAIIG